MALGARVPGEGEGESCGILPTCVGSQCSGFNNDSPPLAAAVKRDATTIRIRGSMAAAASSEGEGMELGLRLLQLGLRP